MSNTEFTNIAESIAAGTATYDDIFDKPCTQLSSEAKTALFTELARSKVEASTNSIVLQEFKGIIAGAGTLEIPSFLGGTLRVFDTDNTATVGQSGTTQFVADNDLDQYVESGGLITFPAIKGRHYKPRDITVPAGVSIQYQITLL